MRPVHGYLGNVAVALPAVRGLYQAVHGMKDRLRNARFRTTRLRPGCSEQDVDAFILEVAQLLPVERGLALTRAAAAMLIVLR
jgi:hypothetical protein